MRSIRLALVLGTVLLSANPAFPHFVKAALGFRLGYSPAEKGYGEKLSLLNSAGKKGVGVQLLSGINNGGANGAAATGEARAASTVGDIKASGSTYGVGIVPAPQNAQGQGRSLGGGGPLEALGGTHGAVKHLKILGLNLYLGGRAAALTQGLGFGGHGQKAVVGNKPILAGLVPGGQGQQVYQASGIPYNSGISSGLVTGNSPLEVLKKPITIGAGIGGKSNLLTNLGPAPNGGKNIGGLHGIRLAAGFPNYGVGMNLGLRHAINTKSPLGSIFGLGNHGHGPSPSIGKYAIGKIPFVYSGKGQDQAYLPGGGVLKGHGHANNLAYSPNSLEGHASNPQMITAQAPQLQLSVVPLHGAAQMSPVTQQALGSQHLQAAPQQHQGLNGPLNSIPSTFRNSNPFLSFLRPRPSLKYTFHSPTSQISKLPGQTPLNPSLQHQRPLSHQHPQAHPQQAQHRPHRPVRHEQKTFSGWSTLFNLGRGHKSSPSNQFVNPLLPNGLPLTKASQASLRPGQSVPLSQAQHTVPFIQQASNNQHRQPQFQQQIRGFHPQYSTGFQNLLGNQPNHAIQSYFPNQGGAFQRPSNVVASSLAAAAPQNQQPKHQDYNFFQLQPFQNFQTAFQSPQSSPFLNANSIQSSPITGTQFNNNQGFSIPNIPFTADSPQFSPLPGFQYSHSTHSQPVKIGGFTMDVDMGSKETTGATSNDAPLYGPLGRKLKRTNKSKSKTRSDVIIKKKDDFPEEEKPTTSSRPLQYRAFNFNDMEASATSNALNTLNSMTLSSSLGETSWTPIIHVEYPLAPQRKSFHLSSSSPVPTTSTSTTTSTTAKTPQIQRKKSRSHSKEVQRSLTASTPPDRSAMVFRRRKLNAEEDQFSPITSSPATTIYQLPLTSSSTNVVPRLSSSVVTTTTTRASPPPSSTSQVPSSTSLRTTLPASSTTQVIYITTPPASSSSSVAQTTTTESSV